MVSHSKHAVFAVTFGAGLLALASWSRPQAASVERRQEQRGDLRSRLAKVFDAVAADEDLPTLSAGVWLGEDNVFTGWSARDEGAPREGLDQARSAPWALEPFAALALLRLAAKDRLELDDALTKHLPELTFGGQTVRIAHVLTHASGIPSYVDHVAAQDVEHTSASVLAWLAGRPLDVEPGSCFAYSESNALIAAALVEKLSGQSLGKALGEWVLEPAGLTDTRLELGAPARGAAVRVGGAPADASSLAKLLGIADLSTTLDDLAALMRAVEGDLLPRALRAELLEVERLVGDAEAPYAFGFLLSKFERGPCLTLAGSSGAGALRVAWHPQSSLVVALATREKRAELSSLGDALAQVVLDIPEQKIVDLPLTKEQCEIYAGAYYMGCTRTTIDARDEQLYFQSPYEGPYRLRYQGEHRFVSAEDDEVRFEFKVEGAIATEFVLVQHGSRMGAVRMK